MRERLYLAHPITGVSQEFLDMVLDACRDLRMAGYDVFCPAEQNVLMGFSGTGRTNEETYRRALMAQDTLWICSFADGVALYDGWETSKGATAEAALATALGIPAYPYRKWIEEPPDD